MYVSAEIETYVRTKYMKNIHIFPPAHTANMGWASDWNIPTYLQYPKRASLIKRNSYYVEHLARNTTRIWSTAEVLQYSTEYTYMLRRILPIYVYDEIMDVCIFVLVDMHHHHHQAAQRSAEPVRYGVVWSWLVIHRQRIHTQGHKKQKKNECCTPSKYLLFYWPSTWSLETAVVDDTHTG